jgi:hypothetical protein
MARARQPTFYNITRYPDVGCYDQDFDEPRIPAASEIFTTCGRRAAHPRHTPGSSDATRESTALLNKAVFEARIVWIPNWFATDDLDDEGWMIYI